jgi:hypothetical protein
VILEVVQPLVVDLVLLRAVQTGELRITPGRAIMARVVQTEIAQHGRGLISIAGELIEAELPRHVKPGDELRLTVRHVTADKVELSMGDRGAAALQAPPPAAIPLPGGATLTVNDEDSHAQANRSHKDQTHTLSLRYETPELGAVDLRFALDAGSLKLVVTVRAGQPHDLAQNHAAELRQGLSDQLHRPVELVISPRREPLDVYA